MHVFLEIHIFQINNKCDTKYPPSNYTPIFEIYSFREQYN